MTDRAEVDAMKRILMATQSMPDGVFEGSYAASSDRAIAPPVGTTDPSIDAMRSILTRFHDASDAVSETLVEESRTVSPLRAALATQATSAGARIGSWEIAVLGEGKAKSFDVRHIDTGEAIASDLRLYEAAQALATALNEGKGVNTAEVRDILRIEEDYSRNLDDAIRFKHAGRLAERRGDDTRLSIMEDRYGEARDRAIGARDELRTMLQGL